ncbi:putative ribosome biogenesis protein Nop16 [Rosa chinensis]|uniref:Nucleolar protein 16 n=1 Tax=Rosa chinensis TaxID=74649 RepID=A0A2P6PWQ1_ROSCH|nr:nucleolar protein 16 [Rosa chinensis]PRQ26363.1 putative ribosome biogenesis protein Nop16 [Rosa chinensis]
MGGSRRKYKRSRTKVRVALPKRKPNVFKPAFCLPPKLRALIDQAEPASRPKWDPEASVIQNYKSFGVLSNPNLLNVRSHIVESDSLRAPPDQAEAAELDPNDDGSDLEEDDLKTTLGKKRRDGRPASLLPLTTIQRVHVSRLIEKYGDDYQRMFMDTKLNAMQHSVATLEKLCRRYHMYKDKNPLILTR